VIEVIVAGGSAGARIVKNITLYKQEAPNGAVENSVQNKIELGSCEPLLAPLEQPVCSTLLIVDQAP